MRHVLRWVLIAVLVCVGAPAYAQNVTGDEGGGAGTLQEAFDGGNTITNATSANPFQILNGSDGLDLYGDPTEGGVSRPVPLGDTFFRVWPGFNGCVRDMNTLTNMLCFNPAGATPLLKYPYQPGYYPLKSVYLTASQFQGDGTQCPARPTVVNISNMAMPSYICTENNSARMRLMLPMPTNWDGSVIYVQPFYSQTAADTGSVALEVAAACRAFGTAFNGTYGTEVDVTDAVLVGSGAIESTLSAAVTPNGTCGAGYLLFLYIDVDGTANPTTAAATLNFLGAKVYWSEISMSH